MAGYTHTGVLGTQTMPAATWINTGRQRRRSISPAAGRGLEKLSHAIEYLTDEFIHAGGSFSADNPQLQAVQLLMALNRQIYLDCPELPTLGERFANLFHLHLA